MSAWGMKTFENDGAMDWLGEFLDAPSETRILNALSAQPTVIQPGLIGKLMGKKSVSIPGELDGEKVLAAAEVVASILGRPSTTNPDELNNPPSISIRPATVSTALSAIDEIMKDSNLRDCWQETEDFQAWKTEVEDLRTRLKRKA